MAGDPTLATRLVAGPASKAIGRSSCTIRWTRTWRNFSAVRAIDSVRLVSFGLSSSYVAFTYAHTSAIGGPSEWPNRRRSPRSIAIFEPLVIGVLTALTTRTMGRVVANLGWSGIELPRPVRPGETIYAESTIGKVRGSHSRPTQGIAEVESRGFVEGGELVCRYQRALLVYRRGAGPYAAAGY